VGVILGRTRIFPFTDRSTGSSNRFMSVAEAMGRALQQTSISTNIKERLDFSCALMNADGSLISNAPNVPVHLGKFLFTQHFDAS